MKLSILIPTIRRRTSKCRRLVRDLTSQRGAEHVEVLTMPGETHSIGFKRNALVHKACGDYIAFVDDDDKVSHNYVPLILNAIKSAPDVIGICGEMTTNGKNLCVFIHSLDVNSWYTHIHYNSTTYYRCPNHLNPVKRKLALQCPFPTINHGEDRDYSFQLRHLLHTQEMITPIIYYYLFRKKRRH